VTPTSSPCQENSPCLKQKNQTSSIGQCTTATKPADGEMDTPSTLALFAPECEPLGHPGAMASGSTENHAVGHGLAKLITNSANIRLAQANQAW
jgi:hypothetical protein